MVRNAFLQLNPANEGCEALTHDLADGHFAFGMLGSTAERIDVDPANEPPSHDEIAFLDACLLVHEGQHDQALGRMRELAAIARHKPESRVYKLVIEIHALQRAATKKRRWH